MKFITHGMCIPFAGALVLVMILVLLATPPGDAAPSGGHGLVERPDRERALEKIRGLHARLELSPRDAYLNYAIATLARLNDIDLDRERIRFPLVPRVTDAPARRTDLFDLAAGRRALHESLMLNELLAPNRGVSSATVAVADLNPPELPSMDYGARLADAEAEGRASAFYPEARFVPKDWIYLRFVNGEHLVAFLAELDGWIRHGLTFYGGEAERADFLFTPFTRLGMPDPRKYPALYEVIPGPAVTVTLSDPFLREGTDVTLILPEGVPSFLFPEPDPKLASEVSRYRGEAGGRILLSSSRKALARVMALGNAEGDAPHPEALAAAADFRYMRTRMPAREDEAGFLYLSEGFLKRLVGPGMRLLESRRIRCASHLNTITYASLLFRNETGGLPLDLKTLVDAGYLEEEDLRCPHGGTYSLSEGLVGSCSVHGQQDRLTPLLELDLTRVTEEEAGAYRRFARAYGRFWRRVFDPVGISLRRKGTSWTVDLEAFPLAEQSLYRRLADFAGGAPVDDRKGRVAPFTVLRGGVRVDPSYFETIMGWLEDHRLVPDEADRRLLVEGFENRVTVGLLDGPMLFDFDLSGFAGQAIEWRATEEVFLAPLLGGANLPLYATVPLRDPEGAAGFLAALERGLRVRGARPEGGAFSLKVSSYGMNDAKPPTAFGVRVVTVELFAFRFRLFYTLDSDRLIVASRPEVIDRVLRGSRPRDADGAYNLKLSLYPGQWSKVRSDLMLGYEEGARRTCLGHLSRLGAFAAGERPLAQRALGARFRCPDGGTYEWTGDGSWRCSVHGALDAPVQGAKPERVHPVMRLLNGLDEVTFTLRFTEEGIHVRVGLVRLGK